MLPFRAPWTHCLGPVVKHYGRKYLKKRGREEGRKEEKREIESETERAERSCTFGDHLYPSQTKELPFSRHMAS